MQANFHMLYFTFKFDVFIPKSDIWLSNMFSSDLASVARGVGKWLTEHKNEMLN